jgi:hypothetical protein
VVPLLLVAWFVTSLVLGEELVLTLTVALAEYAPTSLGLREGVRSLGEVGPRLPIASFAAALPPVVMGELGAVAVLPGTLGFTGRFNLASVAVALVVGWLSASLLVGVLYRAFSPRPIRARPLALGAALTGSFLAGMSLTWLFLLRFGVDVGIAFGGSDLLGTVVVAAVFLYLVQVVLLGGYVLSLVLGGLGGQRAPPEWIRDYGAQSSRKRPPDREPRRSRRCLGVAGPRRGTSAGTPQGPRRCLGR